MASKSPCLCPLRLRSPRPPNRTAGTSVPINWTGVERSLGKRFVLERFPSPPRRDRRQNLLSVCRSLTVESRGLPAGESETSSHASRPQLAVPGFSDLLATNKLRVETSTRANGALSGGSGPTAFDCVDRKIRSRAQRGTFAASTGNLAIKKHGIQSRWGVVAALSAGGETKTGRSFTRAGDCRRVAQVRTLGSIPSLRMRHQFRWARPAPLLPGGRPR
jgi:hypothetical protein